VVERTIIRVISAHYISHELHTDNKLRFFKTLLIIIDFRKSQSEYDESVTSLVYLPNL